MPPRPSRSMGKLVEGWIGNIVNALALLGATGVVGFLCWYMKKVFSSGSKPVDNRAAKDIITEVFVEEIEEIDDAIEGSDPADELAKLGNKRRK